MVGTEQAPDPRAVGTCPVCVCAPPTRAPPAPPGATSLPSLRCRASNTEATRHGGPQHHRAPPPAHQGPSPDPSHVGGHPVPSPAPSCPGSGAGRGAGRMPSTRPFISEGLLHSTDTRSPPHALPQPPQPHGPVAQAGSGGLHREGPGGRGPGGPAAPGTPRGQGPEQGQPPGSSGQQRGAEPARPAPPPSPHRRARGCPGSCPAAPPGRRSLLYILQQGLSQTFVPNKLKRSVSWGW